MYIRLAGQALAFSFSRAELIARQAITAPGDSARMCVTRLGVARFVYTSRYRFFLSLLPLWWWSRAYFFRLNVWRVDSLRRFLHFVLPEYKQVDVRGALWQGLAGFWVTVNVWYNSLNTYDEPRNCLFFKITVYWLKKYSSELPLKVFHWKLR